MDMTSSTERRLADAQDRLRVTALLDRYPDIGIDDTALILRFLKKAPPLQVGLLTADETVKPKLDAFREDHKRDFMVGPKELLIALAIVVGFIALCAFIWDAGA